MASSPIVSRLQCPTCRTYITLPTAPLATQIVPPPKTYQPSAPNVQPVSYTSTVIKPSIYPYSANQPYTIPAAPVTIVQPIDPIITASGYSLTVNESSWRSKFLKMPVLIHGIVEIVLTVLIILLEIVSLGLSTYSATGAGIWCAIPFMTAGVSTVQLVRKYDRSRLWATRVLIAQLVMLVFTFILIGIAGTFVSSNSVIYSSYSSTYVSGTTYGSNFKAKYQVMQSQLAFAILLMFSGFAYVIFYGIVTYLALWKPFHTLDTSHLFHE